MEKTVSGIHLQDHQRTGEAGTPGRLIYQLGLRDRWNGSTVMEVQNFFSFLAAPLVQLRSIPKRSYYESQAAEMKESCGGTSLHCHKSYTLCIKCNNYVL